MSWPGRRVPSPLLGRTLALPLVGIRAAVPAGLELRFKWKRLAWERGAEVSCFWRACFFLGIPTSCVLWRSTCDGGEMLNLHENSCDRSYLLGNAQPPQLSWAVAGDGDTQTTQPPAVQAHPLRAAGVTESVSPPEVR